MGGNRKHVRINNEQGTIIPYGFDDSIEEETNKIELVEGENPDYNRENAIKEFQQKKAKEGSRMLKIPNVQDLYYQRLEMKRMREEIYEKILHT